MGEARDERLYLPDIREAIDKVLRYTAAGREAFFGNPMVQDAVVRNIEITGEAAKGVSDLRTESTTVAQSAARDRTEQVESRRRPSAGLVSALCVPGAA